MARELNDRKRIEKRKRAARRRSEKSRRDAGAGSPREKSTSGEHIGSESPGEKTARGGSVSVEKGSVKKTARRDRNRGGAGERSTRGRGAVPAGRAGRRRYSRGSRFDETRGVTRERSSGRGTRDGTDRRRDSGSGWQWTPRAFRLPLALLAAALVFCAGMLSCHHLRGVETAGGSIRVSLTGEAATGLAGVMKECSRSSPLNVVVTEDDPEIVISSSEPETGESLEVSVMPALMLEAGAVKTTLRPAGNYWFATRKESTRATYLYDFLSGYAAEQPRVTMNMLSDIIPARHVLEAMLEHGVDFPFQSAAPVVRDADIVFGDLECPLSDDFEPSMSGTDFVSPTSSTQGLQVLGLDIVSLANNHSTDFGVEGLEDTMAALDSAGIEYVGAGNDYDEARSPVTLDKRGLRFSFLTYNTVPDSVDASESSPGVAWITMPPAYPENREQVEEALEDIRQASENCDFLVVGFHWSREYTYLPASYLVELAHQACDAGADMVLGQHPHTMESLELYDGKLIAYSLGNFLFDQRFSEQVRQGVVLRCSFTGTVLSGIELVPYRISDDCRTEVLTGEAGQEVLDRMLEISGLPTSGTMGSGPGAQGCWRSTEKPKEPSS